MTYSYSSFEACQPQTFFNFFLLPAEIRQLVYTFIILPPHEQAAAEMSPAGDEKYHKQRHICHESAKSLRLTSKPLCAETTALFFKYKTLTVGKPGREGLTPYSGSDCLHDLSIAARNNVRRLELGFQIPGGDPHTFIGASNYYCSATMKAACIAQWTLPKLERIVVKYLDARDAIELNTSSYITRSLIAEKADECLPWQAAPNIDPFHVDYVLGAEKDFYQLAIDLFDQVLEKEHWKCAKRVYMSNSKSEKDFILHELIFWC